MPKEAADDIWKTLKSNQCFVQKDAKAPFVHRLLLGYALFHALHSCSSGFS